MTEFNFRNAVGDAETQLITLNDEDYSRIGELEISKDGEDKLLQQSFKGLSIAAEQHHTRIIIQSNECLHRYGLVMCICFLSISMFVISIMMFVLGAWLVLPFAGAELVVLIVGAWISSSHCSDADSLTISKNYVHLTKRRRMCKTVKSFPRQWTYFKLEPGCTKHEPSRLLVGSQGKYQEIGEYLIESARQRLYSQLINWIRNNV